MTTHELISLYDAVREAHATLFGLPPVELSAEEVAGGMLREHGLDVARALAWSQVDATPPSYAFELRVWQNLDEAARVGALLAC